MLSSAGIDPQRQIVVLINPVFLFAVHSELRKFKKGVAELGRFQEGTMKSDRRNGTKCVMKSVCIHDSASTWKGDGRE